MGTRVDRTTETSEYVEPYVFSSDVFKAENLTTKGEGLLIFGKNRGRKNKMSLITLNTKTVGLPGH